MNTNKTIYLDFAAAAPLWPLVIETVTTTLRLPGNPGSQHEQGFALKKLWHESLNAIAQRLGCTADELVITSSATESANLAILGSIPVGAVPNTIHYISSSTEHAASYGPLKSLEQRGAKITWLPVNIHGQIDSQALAKAIRPSTQLVSIIAAHNETGAIQPIREIIRVVKAAEKRLQHRIFIHLDAAQWAAWHPLNVHGIGADLITISGSKLGGPHCGLLYIRRGTPLQPIMYGGGQQQTRRPGTENVASAAGLAAAIIETWGQLKERAPIIRTMRNRLGLALQQAFPTLIRRDLQNGLPNIIHLTIPGVDSEQAVYNLSGSGIAVAAGSACSSKLSGEGHRVRTALGIATQDLNSTLRISLGLTTTESEITRAIPLLIDILNRTMFQTKITQPLKQQGAGLSHDYAG